MADEIETLDELVERAELREVVIRELVANRLNGQDPDAVGVPAEELHAPGSPDDFGALDFSTRLADDQLVVRCRIQTRNAYGSFQADAEVLFELPAPISIRNLDIVSPFVEKIGAPAVFPYLRTAVASLAAQLSVPAAPLPLLRPGDVALGIEEPAGQAADDRMETPPDLSAGSGEDIEDLIRDFDQNLETRLSEWTERWNREERHPQLIANFEEALANAYASQAGLAETMWECLSERKPPPETLLQELRQGRQILLDVGLIVAPEEVEEWAEWVNSIPAFGLLEVYEKVQERKRSSFPTRERPRPSPIRRAKKKRKRPRR